MITPSQEDCGRDVSFRRSDGKKITGRLTGFGPAYCYVTVDGISTPVRREELDWAGERPAPGESPREQAARSRIEAAGFKIQVMGEHQWSIEGFTFWPEIGMWQYPDGRTGANGVGALLEELGRFFKTAVRL